LAAALRFILAAAAVRNRSPTWWSRLLRLEAPGNGGRRLFIPMIEAEQWLNTSTAKAPQ